MNTYRKTKTVKFLLPGDVLTDTGLIVTARPTVTSGHRGRMSTVMGHYGNGVITAHYMWTFTTRLVNADVKG